MAHDRRRYRGLAGFRYALRRFLSASEAISQAGGVTAQQYQSLLAIGVAEAPPTMKILAEELLLPPNAAVQMVDRLQKLGLVERAPSPVDGRSVLLILTPQGETLLDALASKHLKELRKQEPLLTAALERVKRAETD